VKTSILYDRESEIEIIATFDIDFDHLSIFALRSAFPAMHTAKWWQQFVDVFEHWKIIDSIFARAERKIGVHSEIIWHTHYVVRAWSYEQNSFLVPQF
jgi:hypothetical protein